MQIQIQNIDTIHSAAQEFIAQMGDSRIFAFYGTMGAGKTTFVKSLCEVMGVTDTVNSPTFAIVNDYGGNPPLVHFDMYKVDSWDSLYSSGFFDYRDMGGIVVAEWSENITGALDEETIFVDIENIDETTRKITVTRGKPYENSGS